MEFGSLNSQQIKAKHDVHEAYCDFWNNIKFRKGWDSPSFEQKDVSPLLDEAAEIVVRIRSYLDKERPGFKLRMMDGSAREYLWTLDHNQENPLNSPDKFVREMVHHTFCDANGYVEGLSKEEVDSFIAQYYDYKTKQNIEKTEQVLSSIKQEWNHTNDYMNRLFALETSIKTEDEATQNLTNQKIDAIEKLAKDLARINIQLRYVLEQKKDELMETGSTKEGKETKDVQISEPIVEEPEEHIEPQEASMEISEESSKPEEKTINSEQDQTENKEERIEEEEKKTEIEDNKKEEEEEKKEEEEEEEEGRKKEPDSIQIEEIPMEKEDSNLEPPPDNMFVEEPKDKKDASILKIQHVAEDVSHLKGDIQLLTDLSNKLQYESIANDPKGKLRLTELQKKCVEYTEGLMKHLLTLDEIVTSQESRPLRKAQVNAVQSMMEEVESVSKRLRGFAQQLQQETKEQNKEETKQEQQEIEKDNIQEKKEEGEEETKQEEKEKNKSHQTKQKKKDKQQPMRFQGKQSDQEIDWTSLKFRPKFEVSETANSFVLAAYIPGMDENDIKIKLSNGKAAITVEGLRKPSKQEEMQMRNLVRNRINSDPYYTHGLHPVEQEDTLLLKAGAGRFGKFSETYQLPQSVDAEGISALYEGGVLKVEIPKIKRRQAPIPQRNSPFEYPSYGRRQNPLGFFGDNDFWW